MKHSNKHILLVAATKSEIAPFLSYFGFNTDSSSYIETVKNINNHTITVLITGIGIIKTTYFLTKYFARFRPDLAINCGICGCYNSHIKIGEILNIVTDEFADLGIENKNVFLTIFESGLENPNQFPFTKGKLVCDFPDDKNLIARLLHLKKANAITVNTTHGKKNSISIFKNKYNADAETMEGAAFIFVCKMEKIKHIQLRSVSNYVEPRDLSKWNIPLAVNNLNQNLIRLLDF